MRRSSHCRQAPRWRPNCSASIAAWHPQRGAYSIAVRRLTDAATTLRSPPPPIQIAAVRDQATRAEKLTRTAWHEVLDGFQFAIAIRTKEQLLLPEERLLAVLRWMVQEMPHRKRWYPVLLRYIDDVAGQVLGFGGYPRKILPSPTGQVPGFPMPRPSPSGHGGHSDEVTGKIEGIIYDRIADFEGSILETESGQRHRFASREDRMLRVARSALNQRARVAMVSERHRPHEPRQIIAPPASIVATSSGTDRSLMQRPSRIAGLAGRKRQISAFFQSSFAPLSNLRPDSRALMQLRQNFAE